VADFDALLDRLDFEEKLIEELEFEELGCYQPLIYVDYDFVVEEYHVEEFENTEGVVPVAVVFGEAGGEDAREDGMHQVVVLEGRQGVG
jgi:hypothetical protein